MVYQSRGSGKHVLCEKPIALNAAEARTLLAARNANGVKIGEAFMVKTHPQWLRTRELIREGRIGQLKAINGAFSYFNVDPKNVRHIPEWGGGGLLDIGSYPVTMSRFMFEAEPLRVSAVLERDPAFGTDRLASAIMEFSGGQAVFTCGTQIVPYQRMQFLGTKARIEIQIPFNSPLNEPTRIFIDDGSDLAGGAIKTETIPACDQYTIQGDAFSKAIRDDSERAGAVGRRHRQHGSDRCDFSLGGIGEVGKARGLVAAGEQRNRFGAVGDVHDVVLHALVVTNQQCGGFGDDYGGFAIRSGEGLNRFHRFFQNVFTDFCFVAQVKREHQCGSKSVTAFKFRKHVF